MARPLKEIDKKTFEGLCGLQCTEAEICGFFDVTTKTLDSWCKRNYEGNGFSKVYEEKRGNGKISLRRIQWRHAEKSAVMAIFLGKQYLGQRDVPLDDDAGRNAIEKLDNILKELKNAAER